MTKIVPLNCAGCGANLQILPEMEIFACAHCGTNQKVERTGGAIFLRRVSEAMQQVQQATDRTASELALVRLEKELREVESRRIERIAAERSGSDYSGLTPVQLAKMVVFSVIGVIATFLAVYAVGYFGFLLIFPLIYIVNVLTARTDVIQPWRSRELTRVVLTELTR